LMGRSVLLGFAVAEIAGGAEAAEVGAAGAEAEV